MDELISESVRLVECGRLGEFAPGEMTFDPADGGREALTRERADFVIARCAATVRADIERERTKPPGEKSADTH